MSVKVGQIYFSKILAGKIVITWVANDHSGYHMIRDDGFMFRGCIDRDDEPIAEYSTWQEAVNSKEFRE